MQGSGNPRAADVAVFGADGRVALVGSTAQGRRTSGLPPVGRKVGGKARIVIKGRAAYEVKRGRVRAVGVGAKGMQPRGAEARAARGQRSPRHAVPARLHGRRERGHGTDRTHPRGNRESGR